MRYGNALVATSQFLSHAVGAPVAEEVDAKKLEALLPRSGL
jgi:hypothetical protein